MCGDVCGRDQVARCPSGPAAEEAQQRFTRSATVLRKVDGEVALCSARRRLLCLEERSAAGAARLVQTSKGDGRWVATIDSGNAGAGSADPLRTASAATRQRRLVSCPHERLGTKLEVQNLEVPDQVAELLW